jgi:hypothetical protein
MEYFNKWDFKNAIIYLNKYLSLYDDEGTGYRTEEFKNEIERLKEMIWKLQ